MRFDDGEHAEAFLLAGFPSDRAQWTELMSQEITNVRAMSLFFCPAMRALRRRGNTIERVCREPGYELPKVTRRPFNDLSSGDPVTLDAVLLVHGALRSIAESRSSLVRAATKISMGGRMRCMTLEENAVVPSYVWVNYPLITEFRKQFGEIGRTKLAHILFGEDSLDNFFHRIEEGEKKKGIKYDYRVTFFTADLILAALKTLYHELPSLKNDKFDEEPTFGQFFSTSHTAGLGAYNRARALPLSAGNLQAPPGEEQIKAVKERAAAQAAKLKEKSTQKLGSAA